MKCVDVVAAAVVAVAAAVDGGDDCDDYCWCEILDSEFVNDDEWNSVEYKAKYVEVEETLKESKTETLLFRINQILEKSLHRQFSWWVA